MSANSIGGAGDITSMVNNASNEEIHVPNEERQVATDKPYDGEDHYQPYNMTAQKLGAFNEWRDKKYEWDTLVNHLNQKLFNNKGFKECQKEIINAALSNRDVMALIPTGGGKSLTFQLPALVNTGYTFVIMPLISLIEDQSFQLRQYYNINSFTFSKFNA